MIPTFIVLSSQIFSISIYSGITQSKLHGQDFIYRHSQQTRNGFKLGIEFKKPIIQDLSFTYGAGISSRGAKIKIKSSTYQAKRWHLYYIDFPVLLQYDFRKKFLNLGNLYVKHGLKVSYLFASFKEEFNGLDKTVGSSVIEHQKKEALSLLFITGLNRGKLSYEVTFNLGLRGIGGGKQDIKDRSFDFILKKEF